jgi:colanic acid/amylovoran biosynthesis glycosyltransferase
MRELFAGADRLLVEGPFMRDRLIELGCPAEKVRIQHIAIPVSEMAFRARRRRPDRPAVAVFAGRFCEQKGVLFALDAARRLRDAGRDDLELWLIGDDTMTDGSYAARVHAFIREHRLADRVRLLGFLNHDEYLAALAEADLFVHPSVFDDAGRSEGGAPTTILEAQALGMPVVSTQHCDIPNVTLPGESAVLVPERDGEALAGALAGLLDDPARWEPMGRAGRRLMEERHDIAREAPRLEELYLELLEAGPV